MMPILWEMDSRRGWNVEVAHIGMFEAVLTCGGAGTVGCNLWIGTFAGDVVAISPSRDKAVAAIKVEAWSRLAEAKAVLEVLK